MSVRKASIRRGAAIATRAWFLGILAGSVLLLGGCGSSGNGDAEPPAKQKPGSGASGVAEPEISRVKPKPKPTVAEAPDAVKLWFTAGEQFRIVEREIPGSGSPLLAAADALLAGPTAAEAGGEQTNTSIPAGVTVERLSVNGEGTATIRLSDAFVADIPAQPAGRTQLQKQELNARLAQVTYTLTQFEDVNAAKVYSGGIAVKPDTSPARPVPSASKPDLSREEFAKPQQGPKAITKAQGRSLPGTRRVQTKLAKLGYLPKGAVDGKAGYQTQQAVIAFQAWNGLGRDGVVGPQTSAALRVARRPRPTQSGPARRIEVHTDEGVTLLIAGGKTRRAIHTSSGAVGYDTPTGSYEVFRKELRSWSVPYSVWLPYASYFNNGIAFHEYADVPTYPASQGCVRVPATEARELYDFATIGTPVVVI